MLKDTANNKPNTVPKYGINDSTPIIKPILKAPSRFIKANRAL